jgi:hypothetical protein
MRFFVFFAEVSIWHKRDEKPMQQKVGRGKLRAVNEGFGAKIRV